jgi:hypothetical protein
MKHQMLWLEEVDNGIRQQYGAALEGTPAEKWNNPVLAGFQAVKARTAAAISGFGCMVILIFSQEPKGDR